ncbi:MAG TPA: transcriptional regulator FtrA [Gammaproteobacteria bacterium]
MNNPLVASLVCDGISVFEFFCSAEIFGLPRPELGPDWYRFETVAAEPGPFHGNFGVQIVPDAGLERLADAGTVLVSGWKNIDAPVPEKLIEALRAAHARGARLVSVCSGSFVLAATGLLDGKRATTHWMHADALQRRYPKIKVDPDVLFVDEGQVLTSAGSAAGIDLCLHIVRRDHGAVIANHVARRLVVSPYRDGGQAQFIERPVPVRERDLLTQAMEHMQRHLDGGLRIAELASIAAMSERTFMRRFKQSTGMTPAEWISVARVDRARELLETTALPMDRIAVDCGFGSAANLRHHFRRRLGITPVMYRDRFNRQSA